MYHLIEKFPSFYRVAHSVQSLDYQVKDRGILVRFLLRERGLYVLWSLQTSCGSHLPSNPMDTGGLFRWVMRPRHETGYLLPSSVDIGMNGSLFYHLISPTSSKINTQS